MRYFTLRIFPLLAAAMLLNAAERPNALFVIRNSQTLPGAMQTFISQHGHDACECHILSEEQVTPERLAKARLIFLEHPSAEFLARHKDRAVSAIRAGRLKVVSDVPDLVQRGWGIEPSLALIRKLLPYWQYGGPDNMLAFLTAVWQEAGGPATVKVPPPVETATKGVYHPDAPSIFPSLAEYLKWYRATRPAAGSLATVNFFHSNLKNRDTAAVDALLKALERQGLAAAGVFGWPHHTMQEAMRTPPDDPVCVMLMFTLSLSKPEDRAVLEKQNVHVINLVASRDPAAVWEQSPRGIPADRVSTSLAEPERNGASDPIVVATTEPGSNGGPSRTAPIDERVEMAARRAARWVALGRKPNHEKRVAILYYNNPPGKGNIGASYLNVPPSIRAVLRTIRDEGYLTGDRLPETKDLLDQLERVGRNVETWAPGEMRRMLELGGMTLVSMRQYREWFNELPERFRQSIVDRWGPPEEARLMAWQSRDGEKFFLVPGARYGNIFLGPQLLRASFAEYTNVQHSAALPPHHGYVAAYLWYRRHFQADAVIHMGRHGTLEWLPGKNAGQAGWDCSEVILGDLPNVNYYIIDGGGEAIQARRRAAAVDLSHLTPMLARTGREERFSSLLQALEQWSETRETSPLLAKEYAATALAEATRLDLLKQLSIDESRIDDAIEKLTEFADSVEGQLIPLGLPTLGAMPAPERQREALAAFLTAGFQPEEAKRLRDSIEQWSVALTDGAQRTDLSSIAEPALREKAARLLEEADGWLRRLRDSPARELAMLPRVLRGEYLPSGPVGDPVAVPDSLPSGRNLHQGDPALIPTKAAWEVGSRMAEQLLAEHRKRKGRIPERISMVLWSGETGRHQGAMEAQALYLMGVQPEWNARGVVDRLRLMTEEELRGRPRVNVVFTVSGLYRDGLADKILMLDRAARLAASAGENALSLQNREVERTLVENGVPAEQAKELAGARVFATAPGSYGFGLQQMVEQSRDKDEPQTMAELYLTKMNYVFSEKNWGAAVPKLLHSQLRGNEAILHSRSSNLYGAVDNDDMYQYMGGLRIASESVGAKPELMIHNLRRKGHEKLEDARQFLATELNARNWNPKWIAEMQNEGYSGAREMTRAVEFLYGWQATAVETVSPTVWKKMYDVYVADEYSLGLPEFFEKANPSARQNLIGRLLEVDRQGTYRFSEGDRRRMLREFVTLTSRHGVSCSANMCGNAKLRQSVLKEAQAQVASGRISQSEFAAFRQEYEKAVRPVPAAPRDVKLQSRMPSSEAPRPLPAVVHGWKVVYVKVESVAGAASAFVMAHAVWLFGGWAVSVLAGATISLIRRRLVAPNTVLQLGSRPE